MEPIDLGLGWKVAIHEDGSALFIDSKVTESYRLPRESVETLKRIFKEVEEQK
jgi:hypothetical protein